MSALSLEAAAEEKPDRIALVTPGAEYTFAELSSRTKPIRALLQRERPRGVALVGLPRIETLLALYAALDEGVPVTLLHPKAPLEQRMNRISRVGAEVVFDESFDPAELPPVDALEPRAPIPTSRPLALLFTSGSTSEPKAAVLSFGAFLAAAEASAMRLGWREDERWLLCMPIAHVGGLSILTRCLAARRTVVLEPWNVHGLVEFAARVEATRTTLLSLVPTQLDALLEAHTTAALANVRAVLLGGAAAAPSLLRKAREAHLPVSTTYGMTETCSQIATSAPESPAAGVGRPLPGIEVVVVEGEIHVRGPTLFSGYLGEPPRDPDELFATGDLGRFDEAGNLHVVGRKKELIVTGGENVSPAEVEAALLEVEGVVAACVFAVPDPKWGELVACVLVVSPGFAESVAWSALEHRLGTFQRPRRVAFVDALAMLDGGKVDRRRNAAIATPLLRPWQKGET